MSERDQQVIAYIASWLEHYIGERSGEISIPEMREFLYQHGFELIPPDEETKFTAADYWKSVIYVTKRHLDNPDRVVSTSWKQ